MAFRSVATPESIQQFYTSLAALLDKNEVQLTRNARDEHFATMTVLGDDIAEYHGDFRVFNTISSVFADALQLSRLTMPFDHFYGYEKAVHGGRTIVLKSNPDAYLLGEENLMFGIPATIVRPVPKHDLQQGFTGLNHRLYEGHPVVSLEEFQDPALAAVNPWLNERPRRG